VKLGPAHSFGISTLQGAIEGDPGVRTLEVLGYGASGWAVHDFPLCSDPDAWAGLLRGVEWAFGPEGSEGSV